MATENKQQKPAPARVLVDTVLEIASTLQSVVVEMQLTLGAQGANAIRQRLETAKKRLQEAVK